MKIGSYLFWSWMVQYSKDLHIGEFDKEIDKEIGNWLNELEEDEIE